MGEIVVEIGVTTFVETTSDVETGKVISHAERIREVVEEMVLAAAILNLLFVQASLDYR